MTMPRRPLSELLTDVLAGTLDALAAKRGIRVRQMSVALPVEVSYALGPGGPRLVADVPRTVTRTPFDVQPGRLHVVWREEAE